MLKKLTFAAVYFTPIAAFAGGGGAYSDGSLLIQAVSRLIGKITGMF
jgi:hypothetical protein